MSGFFFIYFTEVSRPEVPGYALADILADDVQDIKKIAGEILEVIPEIQEGESWNNGKYLDLRYKGTRLHSRHEAFLGQMEAISVAEGHKEAIESHSGICNILVKRIIAFIFICLPDPLASGQNPFSDVKRGEYWLGWLRHCVTYFVKYANEWLNQG